MGADSTRSAASPTIPGSATGSCAEEMGEGFKMSSGRKVARPARFFLRNSTARSAPSEVDATMFWTEGPNAASIAISYSFGTRIRSETVPARPIARPLSPAKSARTARPYPSYCLCSASMLECAAAADETFASASMARSETDSAASMARSYNALASAASLSAFSRSPRSRSNSEKRSSVSRLALS